MLPLRLLTGDEEQLNKDSTRPLPQPSRILIQPDPLQRIPHQDILLLLPRKRCIRPHALRAMMPLRSQPLDLGLQPQSFLLHGEDVAVQGFVVLSRSQGREGEDLVVAEGVTLAGFC